MRTAILTALSAAILSLIGLVAAHAAWPASAPEDAAAVSALQGLPVPDRAAIDRMIDAMAERYGVERSLVHAVVRAESAYDPHAVSHKGAVGLMQVMPATAADYGVDSVEALFDPRTNLRTGVRHLKRLLQRFGVGRAVMAYNAGEGALERHNGFVSYPETQRYTHRVLSAYLRARGVEPYSLEARALTGVTLTPAMARAQGGGARAAPSIDPSRLRLRIRPTLSSRALDPEAHSLGPESKPMFELGPRTD
jgi:soluble lytic murein transglycosylase-like protein